MRKKYVSSFLNKGFTLIELILVIGILAILFAITLIAINPARQFSQANNTARRSDVNAILNAVNQYMADNKGTAPIGIDATERRISNDPLVSPRVDVCSYLVTEYLSEFPGDPTKATGARPFNCSGTYDTYYTISRSAGDNRITVKAVGELEETTITATR